MGKIDLVFWITAITTGLALLVSTIANGEKLKGFMKKYREDILQMKAKKLYEHHKVLCPVHKNYPQLERSITQLAKELNEIKRTSAFLLGDRITQKCDYHTRMGYMPPETRETLLKEFMQYHFTGGNGPVLEKVSKALCLPDVEGGDPYDIDLIFILKNEKERRAKWKH